MRIRHLVAFLLLFVSLTGHAHKPSDSYLLVDVKEGALGGQWDIALRDLEYAIGLDADGDGEITWGEVRARHAVIAAYAFGRLKFSAGGRECAVRVTDQLIDNHSDGAYAVLRFDADCGSFDARAIKLDYRLLFDLDPTHRGLLRWRTAGRTVTAVLGPENASFEMSAGASSRLAQFMAYGQEGIWHIWIGADHVLFLVSLLLPAVFARVGSRWSPIDRFAPALWDVFKVVSAFTLAHSLTLSLAALSIVSLAARFTETAIAFSVLLAALNNLWPLVHGRRWMVAFGFGLVHGFGFASVLADLGLHQDAMLLALVGFNLGVEAGQLLIVAAFLPVAYGVRRTWFYRRLGLGAGSVLIAVFALNWMIERWFDLRLVS